MAPIAMVPDSFFLFPYYSTLLNYLHNYTVLASSEIL